LVSHGKEGRTRKRGKVGDGKRRTAPDTTAELCRVVWQEFLPSASGRTTRKGNWIKREISWSKGMGGTRKLCDQTTEKGKYTTRQGSKNAKNPMFRIRCNS